MTQKSKWGARALVLGTTLSLSIACETSESEDSCTESTWYRDADADGLGDASDSLSACTQPDGYVSNSTDPDDSSSSGVTLHAAFAEFDEENTDIALDGDNVVIEANGLANHTSPYWSSPNHASRPGSDLPSTAHPLFVEPTETRYEDMAPGYIDDFDGVYTLTVPQAPVAANAPSATGLGPIGIAVSGAMIYNDEEGPGNALDGAVVSLDYAGAHTGPQSYHYHLEPKPWSDDDDALIGIMSDGFFLYGRKCASTNTYPDDLDASGGHQCPTQHSEAAEYHYHIQNEVFLGSYYILFPGDLQGTPNGIR